MYAKVCYFPISTEFSCIIVKQGADGMLNSLILKNIVDIAAAN